MVRRPRARLVTSHSGGAGAPPGGTKAPCQELADGGSLALSGRGQSAARRRKENAAMARRKAPHLGQPRCALKEGCAGRRAVPLATCGGKEEGPALGGEGYGAPAPQRIGAMTRA